MARFILSTLQALLAGDVSASDVCYTVSAHLAGTKSPADAVMVNERDIEVYVRAVVLGVADGTLSAESATEQLIALRDDIQRGLPLQHFSSPGS